MRYTSAHYRPGSSALDTKDQNRGARAARFNQQNNDDAPEATLDFQGYNFWLNKLNSFGGNFIAAEMVKAFLASNEYRRRFGP